MNINDSRKLAIGILVSVAALPAFAWAEGVPNTDETVTFWVREALREDPRVNANDITVSSENGIVTLAGDAWTLVEKECAVGEAEKIDGVVGVIDEMTVTPTHRSDMDIARDVKRRISISDSIHSEDVIVTVSRGVVDLTGTVGSWSEQKEAETLAADVLGVKSVANDLRVHYTTERTDGEIGSDVLSALDRDVYLTGLPITVSVKDGVVTLRGDVGNAYEKRRAEREARSVANVIDTNNELNVRWFENRGVRTGKVSPDDGDLTLSVQDELKEDQRLAAPRSIEVDAHRGHVTIRGSVPNYYEKNVAEQDVRNLNGVSSVSDLVNVAVNSRDDGQIRTTIANELASDYILNDKEIGVAADHGKVSLTGLVKSTFEKRHAEQVASRVPGVNDVENDIRVVRDDHYSDTATKARIEDRLKADWETRPVADNVRVEIREGKATLAGNVDSWAEFREAGRIAFLTDGVWSVDNHLAVGDEHYLREEESVTPPDDYSFYSFYDLY